MRLTGETLATLRYMAEYSRHIPDTTREVRRLEAGGKG